MELAKKIIRIGIFLTGMAITFFYFYLNLYSYIKRSNIDIQHDLKTYTGKLLFASIAGKSKSLEIGIKTKNKILVLHLLKSLPKSKENIVSLQKSYLDNEVITIKYDYSNLIWQAKTRSSKLSPTLIEMKNWHNKSTMFTLWGAITFFLIGCSFSYIFFRKKYLALKKVE